MKKGKELYSGKAKSVYETDGFTSEKEFFHPVFFKDKESKFKFKDVEGSDDLLFIFEFEEYDGVPPENINDPLNDPRFRLVFSAHYNDNQM